MGVVTMRQKSPEIAVKGVIGSMKKNPQKQNNVPVGSRPVKRGNSTPKTKTSRSRARYVDLKIRLPVDEYNRGLPYFGDAKNLARYIVEAFREKINRAESNDKAGRLRALANNIEMLLPVITEMYKQGKLNFLVTKQEENKNG
jgi:hypothetical protein